MGETLEMDQSPCLDDVNKNHFPTVEPELKKDAVTNEVSILLKTIMPIASKPT